MRSTIENPSRHKTRLLHEHAPAAWKTKALIAALLIVAPFIVLWPLCMAQFLVWDDNLTIVQNPYLNPPTLHGLAFFWTHAFMQLYVPLTYTLWGVPAAIGWEGQAENGSHLNPLVFHTANLMVHLLCTLLVWALLMRWLRLGAEPPRQPAKSLRQAPPGASWKTSWAAAIGALIFAVHPLQVETVGWASGFKDLLYTLLSLSALWCYTVFAERSSVEGSLKSAAKSKMHRRLFYGIGTACLILSILSKPSAMVTPAIALLIDALVIRRRWLAALRDLSPWFLLAIGCMVLAKIVQPDVPTETPVPLMLRPLIAGDALAFYLLKLIAPIRLVFDYERSPAQVIAHGWLYYTWLLPAAVAAAVFFLRRRAAMVALGLLVFLVAISPMLGWTAFDFQRYSTVADHYVYLPMLGIALAMAAVARYAMNRWPARNVLAGAAIIVLAFGSLAFRQTDVWQDNFSLCNHELSIYPDSGLACNELATAYFKIGDFDHAVAYARRAKDLRPESDSWGSLAAILSRRGELDESAAAYRQALKYAPNDAKVLGSLGSVLARAGHLKEGEEMLKKAIRADADYVPAYMDLGTLKANQGNWVEAEREFQLALQHSPNNPLVMRNLTFAKQMLQSQR